MDRVHIVKLGVAVASDLKVTILFIGQAQVIKQNIGLEVVLWYTVPSTAREAVTSVWPDMAPADPDEGLSIGLFKGDLQGLNGGIATFGAYYVYFTDPGKIVANVEAAIRL